MNLFRTLEAPLFSSLVFLILVLFLEPLRCSFFDVWFSFPLGLSPRFAGVNVCAVRLVPLKKLSFEGMTFFFLPSSHSFFLWFPILWGAVSIESCVRTKAGKERDGWLAST